MDDTNLGNLFDVIKNPAHMIGIVTIARREHEFVQEFVEYHRKVGVSRFYLYDNGRPDEEPLRKTLEDGYEDCVVIPFPGEMMQYPAYQHFIKEVLPKAEEQWFAIIDADEFIVPVKHKTLPAFLEEYGHLGCIGLNWKMFSANGHARKPPEGGVLRNFYRSTFNNHIKTLAHRSQLDPHVKCVHNINYRCRRLDGQLVGGPFSEVDNTDVIRINHYFCKSWSQFKEKIGRGCADLLVKRVLNDYMHILFSFNCLRDTAVLDLLGETPLPHDMSCETRDLPQVLDPAELDEATRFVCGEIGNSTHATDFEPRAQKEYTIVDGYVNADQVRFLTEFLRVHNITRVLEIGFNGGTSASAMLSAKRDVELTSVDIGHHDCVPKAKRLIDELYPGRHTLVLGNSKEVVPKLARTTSLAEYDMVFIDGCHETPMPETDLRNVLPLLTDGGWVVMDDYCEAYGKHGVIQAWDAAVETGKIKQYSVHRALDRGWAVGCKA